MVKLLHRFDEVGKVRVNYKEIRIFTQPIEKEVIPQYFLVKIITLKLNFIDYRLILTQDLKMD